MSDPTSLRIKLFVALLISVLVWAFVNKKLKKQPGQKVDGKGIAFYNVLGLVSVGLWVILIIRTFSS